MKTFFYLACAVAAFAPFLASTARPWFGFEARAPGASVALVPEGQTLANTLPAFAGFPGTIRTGETSRGPFLIREVKLPTRALHSSYDCFRGSGYHLTTPKVERDAEGRQWACFEAERRGERLKVYELFTDADGKSWSDVSSWYWNALFKRSRGPWQAITRVEPL